jgi:hypothetical protein
MVDPLQETVMDNLKKIPDLERQVEALRQSNDFKPLGEALSPIVIALKTDDKSRKIPKSWRDSFAGIIGFFPGGNNDTPEPAPQKVYDPLTCVYCGAKLMPKWTHCNNCGAAVMPKTQYEVPKTYRKYCAKFLDYFAGFAALVIWIAVSALILQNYGLTWFSLIGLMVWWIMFVVVYRVLTGGILG